MHLIITSLSIFFNILSIEDMSRSFSIQSFRLISNFRAVKDTQTVSHQLQRIISQSLISSCPNFLQPSHRRMQYPAVLLVKLNKWTSLLLTHYCLLTSLRSCIRIVHKMTTHGKVKAKFTMC